MQTVTAEPQDGDALEWERHCQASTASFLNSNGAPKRADAAVAGGSTALQRRKRAAFRQACGGPGAATSTSAPSRGLSERFDSTIGAGTVLMPFGGTYQRTPVQAMAAKIPVLHGETTTCSVMRLWLQSVYNAKKALITAPIWRWWNPSARLWRQAAMQTNVT